MNTLASWAQQLARALPGAPAPALGYVQGVAARARGLAPVLGADADLLEAATWLHDIGYAPDLTVTGLHALDGARYLPGARHAGGARVSRGCVTNWLPGYGCALCADPSRNLSQITIAGAVMTVPDKLSVAQRVAALAELERIADTLDQAARWLMLNDADAAGELTKHADGKLAAALWILEGPIRPRERGMLARTTLNAATGHRPL